MRGRIEQRLDRLRAKILDGCPECRDWPLVWTMNETDPEPPERCHECGRPYVGLVRVYVGFDLEAI